MQETLVQPLGLEDLLEEGMATHSVCLPGESHGQKSWWAAVHEVKESNTNEVTEHACRVL